MAEFLDSPFLMGKYGEQPNELALMSCKRNQIKNERLLQLLEDDLQKGNRLEEKYNLAKFKGEPTPTYNCHGMTFACRRTGISDLNTLRQVWEEDNYVEIKEIAKVLPGDIVLYYKGGEIIHSGIVMHVELQNNILPNITILSKWGKHKEVIHNVNDSPYSVNSVKKYGRVNHGYKLIQ